MSAYRSKPASIKGVAWGIIQVEIRTRITIKLESVVKRRRTPEVWRARPATPSLVASATSAGTRRNMGAMGSARPWMEKGGVWGS